jgi:hypothetical protein
MKKLSSPLSLLLLLLLVLLSPFLRCGGFHHQQHIDGGGGGYCISRAIYSPWMTTFRCRNRYPSSSNFLSSSPVATKVKQRRLLLSNDNNENNNDNKNNNVDNSDDRSSTTNSRNPFNFNTKYYGNTVKGNSGVSSSSIDMGKIFRTASAAGQNQNNSRHRTVATLRETQMGDVLNQLLASVNDDQQLQSVLASNREFLLELLDDDDGTAMTMLYRDSTSRADRYRAFANTMTNRIGRARNPDVQRVLTAYRDFVLQHE